MKNLDKKQITLRMPDELYEALFKISKKRGINTHQLIVNMICDFIPRYH